MGRLEVGGSQLPKNKNSLDHSKSQGGHWEQPGTPCLINAPSGVGSVVTLHGLTGLAKAIYKSRLGHLWLYCRCVCKDLLMVFIPWIFVASYTF